MLHTRFIKISSKKQFKLYDKFANENWGEHSNDGDIKLDFFAVPNYAGCLYQNSRKVSSLFIFIRNIEVDNNRYIIAGIGGVVTHILHRHKGFASKLLVDCMKYLQSLRSIDFAILCTDLDRLEKLYNTAGFIRLGKPYYFIDKLGFEKEETGGMVCFLRDNIDKLSITSKESLLNIGASNV